MTTTLPRPLELVRLADDEVAELVELLEQLAPAHRRPGAHRWEAGTGRRLELVDQLVTTATRQDRVTTAAAPSPKVAPEDVELELDAVTARVAPLPYSPEASELAGQLAGALASWVARTVRQDAEEAPVGPRRPAPTSLAASDLAAWLLTREHSLTWRPGSTREELAVLGRLVAKGRRLVDRPADRWYAGPCATPLRDAAGGLVIANGEQAYCDEDLYARPGLPVVVCRACHASHRVERRREELLRLARDYVQTATVISRALNSLGTPCTPERVRQWKRRGRIAVRGVDAKGDPLYRVGDVMELLEREVARPRKRRAS